MGQQTLFEKIGVQYEERDGLFYPLIALDIKEDGANVGKYGQCWRYWRRFAKRLVLWQVWRG